MPPPKPYVCAAGRAFHAEAYLRTAGAFPAQPLVPRLVRAPGVLGLSEISDSVGFSLARADHLRGFFHFSSTSVIFLSASRKSRNSLWCKELPIAQRRIVNYIAVAIVGR
jgi:hypothetical protein